jgi:hypothetical protein
VDGSHACAIEALPIRLCLHVMGGLLSTWRMALINVRNFRTGRFFDGRLYDVLELGVDKYTSIRDFGRAAEVQIGNKVGQQPRAGSYDI